jgi:hypothetical protein
MKITIGTSPELYIAGHNGENADMGNPTGAIYREGYVVTAFIEGGDSEYRHFTVFKTHERALGFAGVVDAAAKCGWSPTNSELWSRRKIYGAATWNGSDEEALMDRDELEYRRRSQGW